MDKQRDFVLRTIEERSVKFVRLWFTDVVGTLKSVALAPAEVEGAFNEGVGFDGSAIEGLTRSYEADVLAHPDPTTFQILPWRGDVDPTARVVRSVASPGPLGESVRLRDTQLTSDGVVAAIKSARDANSSVFSPAYDDPSGSAGAPRRAATGRGRRRRPRPRGRARAARGTSA